MKNINFHKNYITKILFQKAPLYYEKLEGNSCLNPEMYCIMNEKYNIPDYVLQKIKSLNRHNLFVNTVIKSNEIILQKDNKFEDIDSEEIPKNLLGFKNGSCENFLN